MEEFLFPAITGLTLVFAGILIGYFLWFRDRSEQLLFREQIATENETLKNQLISSKSKHSELEEELGAARLKATAAQQLTDDLISSREKLQLQISEHESQLYTTRSMLEQLRSQVTDETRLRAETESKIHQNQQLHLEAVSKLERDWKIKFDQSSQALNHYKSEFRKTSEQKEQLAEKLHASTSALAKAHSELEAQREILDTAKSSAVGMEKEYVTLETSLRSQIELLKESRGQTAAALSAKDLAEESLQDKRIQIEDLNRRLRTACEMKLAWESDREQLKILQETIDQLEKEKSELQDNQTKSSVQLKKYQERSFKLEELELEVKRYSDRCENLELSLQVAKDRVDSLIGQRDSFAEKEQNTQLEFNALTCRTENQQATIERLCAQSTATEHRRQKHHQELLSNLQDIQAENKNLVAQIDNLKAAALEAEALKSRNTETFKKVSEENARLILQVEEFKKLDARELISTEEYQNRIAGVVGQRDHALDDVNRLSDEISRLKRHAKSNEETIRSLRRERGAVLLRNRESQAFPRLFKSNLEYTQADELSKEYGGTISNDPVRGPIFVETPRKFDDLKMIFGVGNVLEKKLNKYGIYTFKQIMNWNDKAIREFSELLTFKDRIRRDKWLEQAEKLYHAKSARKAA